MVPQLEACVHPFFDELRDPNTRLPSGRPLPPLFNFKPQGMFKLVSNAISLSYHYCGLALVLILQNLFFCYFYKHCTVCSYFCTNNHKRHNYIRDTSWTYNHEDSCIIILFHLLSDVLCLSSIVWYSWTSHPLKLWLAVHQYYKPWNEK